MPRTTRTGDQLNLTTASDMMLLELTRDGFREAFGELWSRHHGAIIAAARSFTSYDPEDLAQEAFARVYNSVTAGGEIPISFRAYVATTARRIAIDMSRRDRGVINDSYDDELDSVAFAEADFSDRVLENTTTTSAFRALPTRQREVLWYRDVEDLPVQEIARYVGMSPNATTVLIKRAREAFKVAWIAAQLSPHRNLADECRTVVPKLAKFSRGSLAAAEQARIELHLLDCVHCAALAAEANDLHKKLALVLLPLLLGGGAASYQQWIQSTDNRVITPTAAHRVPIAFSTKAPVATAGTTAGAAKLSGRGAVIAMAAAIVVLGAGVAGATALFAPTPETREVALAGDRRGVFEPETSTTPMPTATPVATVTTAVDTTDEADATTPVTTTVALPAPGGTTSPTPTPTPRAAPEPAPAVPEPAPVVPEPGTEPTPEPGAEPTPEPSPEPTVAPSPEPTPEPTVEPTPDPEPTVDPEPEPTTDPGTDPGTDPAPEPTTDPTTDPVYATPRTLTSVTTTDPFLMTFGATPGATINISIRWQASRADPYQWEYVTLTADENGEASHDFAAHQGSFRYVEVTQTYDTADGAVTPTADGETIVFSNLYIPGVRP